MSAEKLHVVGTGPVRVDAWGKVSGRTRYVDDLHAPGAWLGATVRSPVARGRIRAIGRDPAFDWSQVVVVTAADILGPNVVAMITEDHPILASEQVHFVGEAVALLAAPDRITLQRALAAITLEIDERTPVLSVEEALRADRVIHGTDNVLAAYTIERGDPATAMARADRIIEGTYRTGYQEHLYLEPNGVIALPHADGAIEIVGSLQCPYYIHTAMMRALDLPAEKIIVKQAPTGGAFGGKEDYPSVIALHAALLARAAGRPVKIVYDRSEDIRATTKRHPSVVRHRTGVMADGTFVASEIDVVLDGGAYVTLSPVVLSRSILHAGGVYRWPDIRIRGRAVATNTPPNGAFRGFGAPQSLFAVERHVDRIARELGIEPLELRRRNMMRPGDGFAFGQTLREEELGAHLVLERVLALSGYEQKRAEIGSPARAHTVADPDRPLRGVGLSLYLHGGGFTGAGEERIAGKARVVFEPDPGGDDGVIEVLVSNVEMGQGTTTMLAMLVAEGLGIGVERVRQAQPDTSRVPDSGPTVASRTTMVVGRIVLDACDAMAQRLRAALADREGVAAEAIHLQRGRFQSGGRDLGAFGACAAWFTREIGPLVGEAAYRPPPGLVWDEAHYQGTAYKAYSWGADVAEVEVDPATWTVKPVRITTVVEIGTVIHPILAAGQVEGGQFQAMGWGLMEEVKTQRGRYLNDRMATYIIPTPLDMPPIQVEMAELPYARGPFGAKGLGELPMDGGAPAFAAAVEHATGLFPDQIPVTPERLHELAGARDARPGRPEGDAQRPGSSAGDTAQGGGA